MKVSNNFTVQATNFSGKVGESKDEAPKLTYENDSFESTKAKPQKIGFLRILFHRLSKEQVAEINKTKQLPNGAKIAENSENSKPYLTWNLLGVTPGTQTLPAGYEFKNDIFGFTHLVREGTKGLFIR